MEKLANVLIKSSNSNYIEKHNDAFSKYLVDTHLDHNSNSKETQENLLLSENEEQKTSNNPFLTDPQISSQMKEKDDAYTTKPIPHIYKIEDSELPTNFEAPYTPLPSIVEFNRIIGNIMNALKFDRDQELEKKTEMRKKTRFEKWKSYLEMEENLAIVSDSFWYAICKFFNKKKEKEKETDTKKRDSKDEKTLEIEENLLNRIAKNYVNFFLSIEDKYEKEDFFKSYFDILAQAVFYSFFYAFPKSRTKFNDDLKKLLLDEFSKQFTGVKISNTHLYMEKWCLDLGAGNIFKIEKLKDKDRKDALPEIEKSYQPARNKRNKEDMRYSPIVDRYLKIYKYKTREYLKPFKMKFTEYDENQKYIEERFEKHLNTANAIMAKAKQMKKEAKKDKIIFMNEIKEFKRETVKHQRRLEKRKAEELERGAHEYANYLVSMLNSGITVATLGVGTQKGI